MIHGLSGKHFEYIRYEHLRIHRRAVRVVQMCLMRHTHTNAHAYAHFICDINLSQPKVMK